MDMYGLRRYTGDKNRPKEMTFPAKKKKKQNVTKRRIYLHGKSCFP